MRNPIPGSASGSGTGISPATTSKTPCCSKVGIKRGPWTPEEDELLATYIKKEGEGRWRTLPKRAGLLRCGKSCRLRWMNYLRPSVKRGHIAPDEEDLILRLHRLLGNRWSLIAGRIPGRTDNEIKNYWNTHLSKKLISQGIDPRTHKPLLNPNPNNPSTDLQAPASKPNPNPNPNPNYCGLEPIQGDKGKNHFNGTNLDNGDENWQNSDGRLMMGFQSGHGNSNEDDDIDSCNDEIFSSFLNSLINEEVFVNQQNPNGIAPYDHPVVSSSEPTFIYGTIWETALASSSSTVLNPEEHKRLLDHVNKRF